VHWSVTDHISITRSKQSYYYYLFLPGHCYLKFWYMPLQIRPSSVVVWCLFVTFVHPTQPVEIFAASHRRDEYTQQHASSTCTRAFPSHPQPTPMTTSSPFPNPINCTRGRILHCFRDIAFNMSNVAIFRYTSCA